MNGFKYNSEENYIEIIQRLVKCVVVLLAIIIVLLVFFVTTSPSSQKSLQIKKKQTFFNPIKTPVTEIRHSSAIPFIKNDIWYEPTTASAPKILSEIRKNFNYQI